MPEHITRTESISLPHGRGSEDLASQCENGIGHGEFASRDELAGVYEYHRVGHDKRRMELLAMGLIGDRSAGNEQFWDVRLEHGVPVIDISGRLASFVPATSAAPNSSVAGLGSKKCRSN